MPQLWSTPGIFQAPMTFRRIPSDQNQCKRAIRGSVSMSDISPPFGPDSQIYSGIDCLTRICIRTKVLPTAGLSLTPAGVH